MSTNRREVVLTLISDKITQMIETLKTCIRQNDLMMKSLETENKALNAAIDVLNAQQNEINELKELIGGINNENKN